VRWMVKSASGRILIEAGGALCRGRMPTCNRLAQWVVVAGRCPARRSTSLSRRRLSLSLSPLIACEVFTTPPLIGSAEYCDERACLSVSLCVCLCVCQSTIISSKLHFRSSPNFFMHVTYTAVARFPLAA